MDRKYLEEVKKLLGRDHYKIVGTDVQRVDGLEKVTGQAKYTADFLIENALIVRPVWSRHPHALIKKIDKAAALRVAGVECVITGEDIPGENQCGYYTDDQPFLASDSAPRGRHRGPGGGAGRGGSLGGADAVKVEYAELPGF